MRVLARFTSFRGPVTAAPYSGYFECTSCEWGGATPPPSTTARVGEVLIRRVADAASAPLIATMALGKAPETVTIVHERTSPQGTKVAFLELELRQAVVIAVSHAGVAGGAATPVETVKLSAAQIRYTFRNDDGVTKSGQIG